MKATLYIAILLAAFTAIMGWGLYTSPDLGAELDKLKAMATDRTGMLVLADLYIGFLILAGWIVYRDGFGIQALIIIALMMLLGNFVPLIYILFLLLKTRGDVWQTLLGKRT